MLFKMAVSTIAQKICYMAGHIKNSHTRQKNVTQNHFEWELNKNNSTEKRFRSCKYYTWFWMVTNAYGLFWKQSYACPMSICDIMWCVVLLVSLKNWWILSITSPISKYLLKFMKKAQMFFVINHFMAF